MELAVWFPCGCKWVLSEFNGVNIILSWGINKTPPNHVNINWNVWCFDQVKSWLADRTSSQNVVVKVPLCQWISWLQMLWNKWNIMNLGRLNQNLGTLNKITTWPTWCGAILLRGGDETARTDASEPIGAPFGVPSSCKEAAGDHHSALSPSNQMVLHLLRSMLMGLWANLHFDNEVVAGADSAQTTNWHLCPKNHHFFILFYFAASNIHFLIIYSFYVHHVYIWVSIAHVSIIWDLPPCLPPMSSKVVIGVHILIKKLCAMVPWGQQWPHKVEMNRLALPVCFVWFYGQLGWRAVHQRISKDITLGRVASSNLKAALSWSSFQTFASIRTVMFMSCWISKCACMC